ncbi:MAG: glycosyltransferase, partial [Candidatus Eremiobacteraeota bacterium]|nr:glycosyltransferase [Candidatus Eremiobacteraeota bacterium]
MASPDASVIILGYRTIERARTCVHSILAAGAQASFEIIVMLNAVGKVEAARFPVLPRTKVLHSPLNLGFSGGNNYAARYSAAEYVIFMNDDTLVEAGWLDALVRTARRNPDAGAVGSCILFPDGSLQEAGSVIWADGTTAPIGRGSGRVEGPCATVQTVDFCSANGLLVRRSSWTQLGGFDERFYPAYYEDVDLCMGIRHRLGQRVLYEPRSKIRHLEAASSDPNFRSFLFARNVRHIREKWRAELPAYPKPVQPLSSITARRHRRTASVRVLIIDDRVPDAGLGSGFGRFREFFAQVRDQNYAVAVFCSADTGGDRTVLEDAGAELVSGPLDEHLRSADARYDVVIISRPHNYERFASAVRQLQTRAHLIYDAEALFHRRLFKQADFERDTAKARVLQREAKRMLAVETQIARSCDRIVCISFEEQRILRELGAREVDLQLPLARDAAFGERSFDQRAGMIFVAGWLAGEESPNVPSLRWFVERILPLLSNKPEAHLRVSGANLPASLSELAGDRVRFVGFVDDLPAFYDSARVAIAPILYGAGTKIKTIEALQHGVPVVATPVGA